MHTYNFAHYLEWEKIMKKVLLITLWGYDNFGNRLQAIALKKMIESNGYFVDCVPNDYSTTEYRLKKKIQLILGILGFQKYRCIALRKIRNRALKKSSLNLLFPLTPTIHNFNSSGKIDIQNYSAAVVGSDQVWHRWTVLPNELKFYYLDFVPTHKRISYAASFGFEVFPPEDKTIHIQGLEKMNLISCREVSGCQLVEQFTNNKAELVLDPTLCVDKSFWDSIEIKPSYSFNKNYILVMLLGSKQDYYNVIKKYAAQNNLDIIDLTDINYKAVWKTSINNFIWLVHHAKIVCTDSFHCSVFSIIYEKPITIFKRKQLGFEKMYDRIATLLDICKLHQCEYQDHIVDSLPDYVNAKESIAPIIEKSRNWLSLALKTVDSQKGVKES